MSPKEDYRLTYFHKRGAAELMRLLFVTAGQDYTDERLDMNEWSTRKPDMPLKNLPVLTIIKGDKEITYCQSAAIARYLSRTFGLYTSTVEEDLLIDEVFDSVADVRTLLTQKYRSKDEKFKNDLDEKLKTTSIPHLAAYIKRRMSEYGEKGFIIGNKLTLADVALFNLIDSCEMVGFGPLWESYTQLLQHHKHILDTDQNIANWIQNRPKTQM